MDVGSGLGWDLDSSSPCQSETGGWAAVREQAVPEWKSRPSLSLSDHHFCCCCHCPPHQDHLDRNVLTAVQLLSQNGCLEIKKKKYSGNNKK